MKDIDEAKLRKHFREMEKGERRLGQLIIARCYLEKAVEAVKTEFPECDPTTWQSQFDDIDAQIAEIKQVIMQPIKLESVQ